MLTQIQGLSGIPEVGWGTPSPPQSPPPAANIVLEESSRDNIKSRRREAASTIAQNCERILCEDLRATFLGEGNVATQDLHAMGTSKVYNTNRNTVQEWIEVWGYIGNNRFHGFVVCDYNDWSLFVFFEPTVVSKDLKPGSV